jgi:hypothetical protein
MMIRRNWNEGVWEEKRDKWVPLQLHPYGPEAGPGLAEGVPAIKDEGFVMDQLRHETSEPIRVLPPVGEPSGF